MGRKRTKVLVLGVTGMLGSTVFKSLAQNESLDVFGTLRRESGMNYFPETSRDQLIANIDVLDNESLIDVMAAVRPDVVINCTGLIKQLSDAQDPLFALPINAMLPHKLARLCSLVGARMIHISTDCVFSGRKGMYKEGDVSDAEDLYGKSKYIGEIAELSHVVTLRTSIIGHGLNSNSSLVDWFLSQKGSVKGYKKAIFSGLPTVELAMVIKDYVIPNLELTGLYHVSADPIDKHALLLLIAKIYKKNIRITSDEVIGINRSLDSTKFLSITGYKAPEWESLIKKMYLNQVRREQ